MVVNLYRILIVTCTNQLSKKGYIYLHGVFSRLIIEVVVYMWLISVEKISLPALISKQVWERVPLRGNCRVFIKWVASRVVNYSQYVGSLLVIG